MSEKQQRNKNQEIQSSVFESLPAWPQIDFEQFGEVERRPRPYIKKITAKNLTRNSMFIPQVANFNSADVTELEEYRKEQNRSLPTDRKLTMLAFLIKASAQSLLQFPTLNSSLDGDELVLKKYVHIAFAVDTEEGLLVPVVRDCDKKSIFEIADEIVALSLKSRTRKLKPNEMQGACFTISSLGGIGGDGFTPIVNAPEVAILGAMRTKVQPIWDGAGFQPRVVLPVSLCWDHRVVDGVLAAKFLGHVTSSLTHLKKILL